MRARTRQNGHRGRRPRARRVRGSWFSGLLLLCAAALTSVLPITTFAATADKPTMYMSASAGYGGYYIKEDWVPVAVTIHHVGAAQNATLSVHVNDALVGGRRLGGSLKWNVRLPANGWTTTEIDVPGVVVSQGASVTCSAGGVPLYTAALSGNAVTNVALIAVLATSSQATQFLAGSSTSANPVLAVALNPSLLPTSVNLFDGLTAVVTSLDTLAGLSTAQQEALQNWVKLGGLLVISGTDKAPAMWRASVPLEPGSEKLAQGSFLSQFANSAGLENQIGISVGGVGATARLWAGTNQAPLLASESLGRGQIWQTAFSPMDPTLLGWSGNPLMWTAIFKHGVEGADSALAPLFSSNGAESLASVGDALAPLRVPSLPVFGAVFALYLIVIGPVLFLVLRRFRRAHWAWGLLPIFSGITTIGIYLFGGTERPSGLLMDGVGVVDLSGDGRAESYGVEAFMSPYPGGLDFSLPSQTLAVPMSVKETLPASDAVVGYTTQATNVQFRNVGRWRVRYVYAAHLDENSGEFVTNLSSAYGLLFGTVTNDTPYQVDHAAIVWENHMYRLGTLKPGQMVELNPAAATVTTQWISDYGTYNRDLTHGIGRSLGAYLTQFSASATTASEDADAPTAMLIATTDKRTSTLPAPAKAQDVSSDKTLVLVRQYADVNPGIGGPLP
ncbi:hypothetical protein [Alicyclobacillus fastidiosus]|uniref:Uncharacterized protein n=1 Tax=Alicyclobacillus fastidiosus TaxID=392011 RepID=A0ABV5ACP5_9BACL|nr:hypothetical protein [Alicyclobacillus fastidiosus]WEH11266.1 hypothetical protein PYS47_08650 [Alicyclobacillus fastidiosus]